MQRGRLQGSDITGINLTYGRLHPLGSALLCKSPSGVVTRLPFQGVNNPRILYKVAAGCPHSGPGKFHVKRTRPKAESQATCASSSTISSQGPVKTLDGKTQSFPRLAAPLFCSVCGVHIWIVLQAMHSAFQCHPSHLLLPLHARYEMYPVLSCFLFSYLHTVSKVDAKQGTKNLGRWSI